VSFPAPGVYRGVSSADYHALPFCSNSRLSLLKRSPAHLRADLDAPREVTDAMRLGTAIHSAVLEPEDFETRYTEANACEATKKDGSPCSNPGVGRVGGVWGCGVRGHLPAGDRDRIEVLSRDEFFACFAIRDAIRSHPRIGKLLSGDGENELTVIWDDPDTGVRCKARIDRLARHPKAGGVLVDLKSTTDAREAAFTRKVFDLGYYRQFGMYQDALRAHGVETLHMVIVAVEKEAPYAVAGYRLTEAAADAGRQELRTLMKRYAECERSGNWPGYSEEITELSLPTWAWSHLDEQEIAA
jgi:hypothetical protein